MKKNPFESVVGQEAVKRSLTFYLDGTKGGGIMPNILLVAPKGLGKSYIAKKIGANLTYKDESGKIAPKPFLEINSSTIDSMKALFKDVFVKNADKHVTYLFDECSELKREVSMSLLTILNPNPQNQTSFSLEDYTVNFDFSKQTFLFATSESDKFYKPLADRLKKFELRDYNTEELAMIIKRNFKDVSICQEALEEIASSVRGNARQAQVMASDMKSQLGTKTFGKDKFTMDDWVNMRKNLDIKPLGISPLEFRLMELLNERQAMTVTALSASMGLSMGTIRKDIEHYLLRMGLITIGELSKRRLTAKGQEYINNLQPA